MLVRTDLSQSQQAVQACHAAAEASRQFLSTDAVHPHLVLCGVEDEARLKSALAKIRDDGIRCAPFIESDLNDEMTAFASEPVSGDLRKHFRRFKLLNLDKERAR